MNTSPEFLAIVSGLAKMALEVVLIVGVAEGLARLTASAPWRRIIWQGCLASVAILVFVESSGFSGELASWAGHAFLPAPPKAEPASLPILIHEESRIPIGFSRSIADPPAPTAAIIAPALNAGSTPLNVSSGGGVAGRRPKPEVSFAPTPDPTLTLDAVGLVLIWMAGAIWFLGRTVAARLIYSTLFWRQRQSPAPLAIDSIDTLARTLGIRRQVRLIECARLHSPVVFGGRRPTIGIPTGLAAKFSPVQQSAMLSHEMAHLASRDPFWYLLSDLVAAVLWWHPLLWWARRRLRDASEQVADEASLLIHDGPQALAECLVLLGREYARRSGLGAPGFEGTGFRSGLAQRVERLCHLRAGSWQPLGPLRSSLARAAGSTTLVAIVVVGAGWTNSQTINQGDSMKTIRSFWTQSMSALALLAAAEPGAAAPSSLSPTAEQSVAVPAPPIASATANRSPSVLVKDATLLFELGKYDEAARKYNEALQAGPENRQAVEHYLQSIQEKRFAQATATPRQTGAENAPQPAATSGSQPTGLDPKLMERYGLGPQASGAASGLTPESARKSIRLIQSRLDQIVFNEIRFESLPLTEVLKFLSDESRKRDKDQTGINFLINPNALPDPNPTVAIDPTTGIPVAPAPAEPTDMSEVIVNFTLPLRNVRLADVLNAIVKVADKPIQFSVEEYGVVFSQAPGPAQIFGMTPSSSRLASTLAVRTFKADTNTFLAGLESAFGISTANPVATNGTADRSARSRDLQGALRKLMQQLGVKMDDPLKAVFYNDLTGVLMVRATPDDLALVEAAVETLGGGPVGGSEPRAASYQMNEELRRRYGLLPANSANSNNLK